MSNPVIPKKSGRQWTIKNLNLNLDAAHEGKTWLLLPEGFRALECGSTYPLPSQGSQIRQVAAIVIPPGKVDSGVRYIKRAIRRYKEKELGRVSATNDIAFRRHEVVRQERKFTKKMKQMEVEAQQAVNAVRKEAEKASASLKELFALGRDGLKKQMEAYLANEELHGEKVNHAAFRDCYGKVAQTVKNLGMPEAKQQDSAREAIMEQAAEQIRGTQEAIGLAPGTDEEQ